MAPHACKDGDKPGDYTTDRMPWQHQELHARCLDAHKADHESSGLPCKTCMSAAGPRERKRGRAEELQGDISVLEAQLAELQVRQAENADLAQQNRCAGRRFCRARASSDAGPIRTISASPGVPQTLTVGRFGWLQLQPVLTVHAPLRSPKDPSKTGSCLQQPRRPIKQ